MKSFSGQLVSLGLIAALAIAAGTALAAPAPENFDNHCSKCHGTDGKGQTKMGKKLNVKDMTTAKYKADLDEAKAVASLKEGIKKDGKEIKKSFAGELSDADLKALVGYVKGLK